MSWKRKSFIFLLYILFPNQQTSIFIQKNHERILKMDVKVVGIDQSCCMLECKVVREVNVTEKSVMTFAITPIRNIQD